MSFTMHRMSIISAEQTEYWPRSSIHLMLYSASDKIEQKTENQVLYPFW